MDDKGAQKQAEELVKKLNPDDKPNVERVRKTKGGGRSGDQSKTGPTLLPHYGQGHQWWREPPPSLPPRDSRLQPGITRFQSQEVKTQKPLAKVA